MTDDEVSLRIATLSLLAAALDPAGRPTRAQIAEIVEALAVEGEDGKVYVDADRLREKKTFSCRFS